MEVSRETHGRPMGEHCKPMGVPWVTNRRPMGVRWETHGRPLRDSWENYGIIVLLLVRGALCLEVGCTQ